MQDLIPEKAWSSSVCGTVEAQQGQGPLELVLCQPTCSLLGQRTEPR